MPPLWKARVVNHTENRRADQSGTRQVLAQKLSDLTRILNKKPNRTFFTIVVNIRHDRYDIPPFPIRQDRLTPAGTFGVSVKLLIMIHGVLTDPLRLEQDALTTVLVEHRIVDAFLRVLKREVLSQTDTRTRERFINRVPSKRTENRVNQ